MKPGSALAGHPVIDLLKGRKLGQISRLIIDPEAKKVVGFAISTGNPFGGDLSLPLGDVKSIGDSAVTVTSAEQLSPIRKTPEFKKGFLTWAKLKGTKVITESGNLVGELDDFAVDWKTGSFRSLTITETAGSLLSFEGGEPQRQRKGRPERNVSISAQYLYTIGQDAVIVSDSVEQSIRQALKHEVVNRTDVVSGQSKTLEPEVTTAASPSSPQVALRMVWDRAADKTKHFIKEAKEFAHRATPEKSNEPKASDSKDRDPSNPT